MNSALAFALLVSGSHQQTPYASSYDGRLRNVLGKPPSLSATAERKGRDLLVRVTLTNNSEQEVAVPPFSMEAIIPTLEEKISGKPPRFKERNIPCDNACHFRGGLTPDELVLVYPGNRVSFDFMVEGFYSVKRKNYYIKIVFEEQLADKDGVWKGTFSMSTNRIKLP